MNRLMIFFAAGLLLWSWSARFAAAQQVPPIGDFRFQNTPPQNTPSLNTPAPNTPVQDMRTEDEKIAAALEARETAELAVEADMLKVSNLVEALANNLGQMHYVRTLCYGLNDQKWRNFATQMMEVETQEDTDARRTLTRTFNAGFYQAEARYNTCSKDVSVYAAALAENGRNISNMLSDPFREKL